MVPLRVFGLVDCSSWLSLLGGAGLAAESAAPVFSTAGNVPMNCARLESDIFAS